MDASQVVASLMGVSSIWETSARGDDLPIKENSISKGLGPLKSLFNVMLGKVGAKIVRAPRTDERTSKPSYYETPLPENAERFLDSENLRLEELKRRYSSLDHPARSLSTWTDRHARSINLRRFRGDNPFVWQYRDGNTESNYLITMYYIKEMDELGLLQTLAEDGLFGAYTFDFLGELTVSRDLLDSIIEIYFLEHNLGITSLSGLNILDIGAGYGRLAHRMVEGLPNIERYFCTDAIAESTFLSEYYLRFRGVDHRARVVPLYDIEEVLATNHIDIAVNVHSFSECTLTAITWWLDTLKKYNVKYLMIVPNAGTSAGTTLVSREVDKAYSSDFLPVILSRGYEIVTMQPKYLHPEVQRHGISPTYYYLFELKS